MTPLTPTEMVREAGGFTALAQLLNVTRQTVHRWHREGAVPEIYQFAYIGRMKGKRKPRVRQLEQP